MEEKEIRNLLIKKDIRITNNRIAIVDLLSHEDSFYTIAQIIKKTNMNTKSIYNTIKLLIDNGLVDAISFGGVPRYSLNDNFDGGNEIHLINKGNIDHLEINKSVFDNIRKEIKTKTGNKKIGAIKIFVDVE